MNETQKIKQFSEKFFENLGCNLNWQGGVLKVENVPKSFQSFYGKPEPYYLCFDDSRDKSEEYVTKGSYLLNCMNKYLKNKGDTTLLRIKFDFDTKKLIRNRFSLMNCSISDTFSRIENDSLLRFTFSTKFQYLNKKDEYTNSVFVKDGKVVDFDLDKYKTEEGKKREIKQKDYREDYETAKETLRERMSEKTEKLKQHLIKKLEKEKQRIENHHEEQLKDRETSIKELKNQLEKLEKKEKDKKVNDKIEKTKEQIKELESEDEIKRLEKEKQASIKEETYKHSLDIKNNLLNTTIISFPVYNFRVYLKGPNDSRKILQMKYNPVEDTFSEAKCDSCNKEISEFILCSSGHLTCRDCGDRCGKCNEVICKECNTYSCSECGKLLCKNCVIKCLVCHKPKCPGHLFKDEIEGKDICKSCIEECSSCGKFVHPKYIRKTKNRDICERCIHKDIKKKTIKNIFES